MAFGGLILTNTGRNSIARAVAEGTDLELSHIEIGEGIHSGSYVGKKALTGKVMEIPISSIITRENEVIIEADWNSTEAPKAFYFREIGVVGSGGLYYYDSTGTGEAEYIDPDNGRMMMQRRIRCTIVIDDDVNVTTNITSSLYTLEEEFLPVKEQLEDHVSDKDNPHEVTKSQVGLGNVPNVATNDQTPTFTEAGIRANIASGERLSVILGKIKKFFADLAAVAFSGEYGDLKNKPTIPPAVSVKGNAESSYRTGEVNITPANIGLGNVNNTADKDKPISTATQSALNALSSSVTANSNAINTLNGSKTTAGSVKKTVADEIAGVVANAPQSLDTLKEIADWIGDHADDAAAMNAAISGNATAISNHTSNKSNPHNVTKSQIGLGNVENKSSATIRGELTKTNVTDALGYTPPTTDTKYTHPTYTSKTSGLYKVAVDGTGHVSGATAVVKKDITDLGIPSTNTTYSAATTSSAGLMSATDKAKLDGIEAGATKDTDTKYGLSISGHTVSLVEGGSTKSVTVPDNDTNTTYGLSISGHTVSLVEGGSTKSVTVPDNDTVYTHPTYTSKTSGLYKITVDGTGHVSGATAVTKKDITDLGISEGGGSYSVATESADGLMSAADKKKLDGMGDYVEDVRNGGTKTIPLYGGSDGYTPKYRQLKICAIGKEGKTYSAELPTSIYPGFWTNNTGHGTDIEPINSIENVSASVSTYNGTGKLALTITNNNSNYIILVTKN